MHKNILILLLIVTANPVWADWIKMFKSNSTYYIDQTNIRKNGQFAKVWTLDNLNEVKHEVASIMLYMNMTARKRELV